MTGLGIAVEAERSLAALRNELLVLWQGLYHPTDHPLVANRDQICRLTAILLCAVDSLQQRGSPTSIEEAIRLREAVQGAHIVWQTYRERLAQRQEATRRLGPVLRLADDLARRCFRAGLPQGTAATLEPPLCVFASEPSPAVLPRGVESTPPHLTDPSLRRLYASLVLELPIPLVLLPWNSWTDLGGLAAIGHEVGHVIERDRKLDVEEVARRAVAPAHGDLAASLAHELFGDFWGIATCGDVYVRALAHAEADRPGSLHTESARDNGYPRALSRLSAALHLLSHLDLPDALGVAAAWTAAYGNNPMHDGMQESALCIRVLEAFAAETWWPGFDVVALAPPPMPQDLQARLRSPTKGAPGGTDPRCFVRAAALLDPPLDAADVSGVAHKWHTAGGHTHLSPVAGWEQEAARGGLLAERLSNLETP